MATRTRTTAEKEAKTDKVENDTNKEKKTQERANMKATEDTFIYIGPTTRTGLTENAVFHGSREDVEKHLKTTLEQIPQIRLLIVTTESLAQNKAKVKTTGTLLNKYYNDVLSLSKR